MKCTRRGAGVAAPRRRLRARLLSAVLRLNLAGLRSFDLTPGPEHLAIAVPDDLAFFAGHFPGAPVVPGAALLQLALQHGAGDAAAIELERIRFLAPAGPGAQLALRTQRAGERATFAFTSGAQSVAQGSLLVTPPARPRTLAAPLEPTRDLPDPRAILPHQGVAVLLRALTAHAPRGLRAVAQLAATSPFAAGAWASAALIEAAAQAAAAHGGLGAQGSGAAPRGFLVGIKALFLRRDVPLARDLDVQVERTGTAGALAIYQAQVQLGVELLLFGELSVFVAPST